MLESFAVGALVGEESERWEALGAECLELPFGGAGPIHAGAIADSLRMKGLVVPQYPGVFSAIGLLMSDVRHDYIRSRMIGLAKMPARWLIVGTVAN